MNNNVWERFKKNIKENNLINSGDKVLLLNSLGKDSAMLTDLFCRLRDEINFELIVIIFKIPIHAYQNDVEFCKLVDFWKQKNLIIKVIEFEESDLLWEQSINIKGDVPCNECRRLRNIQIKLAIDQINPNKVAAGFNLTDLQSYLTMMQLFSDYTFDIDKITNIKTAKRFISLLPRHFMKVDSFSKNGLQWILPIIIFDDRCVSNYLEEQDIPFLKTKCKFKSDVSRSVFKEFVEKLHMTYEFESSYNNLINFLIENTQQDINEYVNDNWLK